MKNPTISTKETSGSQSDGALYIRPLSGMDKERLRQMFSRLSQKSIYQRFHSPYPSVPERVLDHLSEVNRRDARTFIAIAGGEVVGHAMFVRESNEAEVAVVVEDGWQSKGVGKLLLFRLAAYARKRGIEAFTATVLADNQRMLGLLDAVFAGAGYTIKDGAYQVRVPLSTLRPLSKLEVLDVPNDARLAGDLHPAPKYGASRVPVTTDGAACSRE